MLVADGNISAAHATPGGEGKIYFRLLLRVLRLKSNLL